MRKFRIDASKKIYGAVASGELWLMNYVEPLVEYATPKITEVYDNANNELQQIISEYATTKLNLAALKDCLNPAEDLPMLVNSELVRIVPDLEYCADEDGSYTWINVYFIDSYAYSEEYNTIFDRLIDATEFQDDSGQYYLGDEQYDSPAIVAPEIRDFVISLVMQVSCIYEEHSIPEGDILTALKQVIDGYCDFVHRYCSERTRLGLETYLKEI